MLFFALCLMILATAAARIPVKGFREGICHMYCERCFISQEAMVCCKSPWLRKKIYKENSVICLYL